MWRRAPGRLAASVVLVGGLLDCATAPKPVEDDERPQDHAMHCDYTPTLSGGQLAPLIEKEVQKACGPGAVSGGRYGEIRVVVRARQGDSPLFETEGGDDLGDDDRRCVAAATRRVLPFDPHEEYYANIGDLTIDLALGTPPPLFPPMQALLEPWLGATRSKAARGLFAAQLPAEVALTDDGCLSIPRRPAVNARLERWLASVESPLDDLWRYGLLDDLLPEGKRVWRAYLLAGPTMLLHHVIQPDRSRQEICLLPLDDRLREALQARVDRRATCWAGDLREVLLHPRTQFPTDRRFKTVAVGGARTCAIDEHGTPVCCGARLSEEIPAGPFTTVAVGSDYDCGLNGDGTIRCWGQNPPLGGAEIAGPFAQVAVGGRDMCAIRQDTGALECWFPNQPTVTTLAPAGSRSASFLDHGLCALMQDGRARCWGPEPGRGWSELDGRFRVLATGGKNICGVTVEGDAVRCWRDAGWPLDSFASTPSAVARVATPDAIALSGGDHCILDRSGGITCTRALRPRWPGVYQAIAGGDDRVCALTVDGRIACDREWPRAAK